MVTVVGEAEKRKATRRAAVTVSATMAVCVTSPPVPVTMIAYVPVAVVEATVMVMVEEPEPGAAMDVGLKPTVTPVGWPVRSQSNGRVKAARDGGSDR